MTYPDTLLYGVCSHPWALTERDCQEMKTLGVKYVRMDFGWSYFEPTRDTTFRFSQYDQYVNWASANDLEIVAVPMNIPSWLRPAGGGSTSIPVSGPDFDDLVTQYGEFVYALVSHYTGSIKYFEIWNEPNTKRFWDDPEGTIVRDIYIAGEAIPKYVSLLKEAYVQAKLANPDCKIISGGIANDVNYLQGMYDNGVQGYFDYFGSHPYFNHGPNKNYDPDYIVWDTIWFGYFPKIELMREIMVSNGDVDKDIFITELGIGDSEGPEGPTTDEMRADRLQRVFEKIDHDPGYPFIKGVMWYQFRDSSSSPSYAYCILNEDYTPRLIYYAYKDVIS
jgi:GH35 family endo-1,4-beta-xylanase